MLIPQQYAGAKQLVYVAEIPGWRYSLMSVKKRGLNRPICVFDLWGSDVAGGDGSPSFINARIGKADWKPIWLISYDDKMGSSIYKPLDTGFPITQIGQRMSDSQIFEVNLNYAPLVPENTPADATIDYGIMPYGEAPPTWDAEVILYKMATQPAFPLLVSNSVPSSRSTKCIGPVFMSSMDFTCGDNRDVTIEVRLSGGKFFKYDNNLGESGGYDNVYRNANFLDCSCVLESDAEVLSFKTPRIMSMTLRINQTMDGVFPCSTINTDEQGARFMGMTHRGVQGSIVVLSKDKSIDISLYNIVTMYFGGPYFFPMRNIRWQKPEMQIKTDQGFLHTYNFIALADPSASFDKKTPGNLSEFNILETLNGR